MNWRPHPYQYRKAPVTQYPFMLSNTRKSLQHNGFRVLVCRPVPARFAPFVGRFVGKCLTSSRRIQSVHVSYGSFSCQIFSRSTLSYARPVSFYKELLPAFDRDAPNCSVTLLSSDIWHPRSLMLHMRVHKNPIPQPLSAMMKRQSSGHNARKPRVREIELIL